MKKLIMGGVLVLTMIATQVTPASAKTYTRSVQLGGAKGQYITYTLDTAARRNLVFPLNFVYHDKGKADGAFSSSLTKGDEFGVEASITYNMDAYFAGVEVSAGVSASVSQSQTKDYTHERIKSSKKSGYYIIEGTVPGKTTKTSLRIVNCSNGKVKTNKSDSYGFTPGTSAIIGFHARDGVAWPESEYKADKLYVLACKAMGIS
ncbi:MAG: hypothetical protein K6G64_08715 [Eubacterium sp.]|nr:hypothetical protein [Eubacterium sp.]